MTEHTTALPDPAEPTYAPSYDRPPRTVKVAHLVVGLVFLGIAAVWALNAGDVVGWGDSKYAFPLVLVGAGVIGLVATVAAGAGRSRRAPVRADSARADSARADSARADSARTDSVRADSAPSDSAPSDEETDR
jgi:hypothetical protein